ncbi:PREDICTED: evolutionarily conserved signaling intermediate in Toll pathway, mitochondrial [Dufourea novaeangliae]|nr:PREDICTED: evolutionarily conserved signaling intermediate in Toll pathway, mitochondrial [Dufourea novaeangliae]
MNFLTRRICILLNKVGIAKESKVVQLAFVNYFHNNQQVLYNTSKGNNQVIVYPFHVADRKEKETYLDIIRLYVKNNNMRRGQAEFILHAMKYMDEFGVNKDLDTYKALLDVFPKGDYIPRNMYQNMLYHYPKQQDTALQLLSKMESNRVIPDYEMQEMILNIFGEKSQPARKFWRIMYWMPKFCRLNPWPVPEPAPREPKELAYYGIKKLCSIDVQAKITEYKTKDVPDAMQELLAVQSTDKSLFIEGPFMVWVADSCLDYFVLKGEPIKREVICESWDDVSDLKIPFWEQLNNKIPVTIHEQDDGVYYAICFTGTSSKDSLLSWIRCLQKTNPALNDIPIVFKIRSAVEIPLYIEKDTGSNDSMDNQDTKMLKDKK